MQITLPVIRELLRAALGFNSFVAGFIQSINPDKAVPTACIDRHGNVLYSPRFVKQYVRTRQDLFCLVFHELLHPFFRHYAYGSGTLVNIACDAVINASISQLFAAQSGAGSLFKRLYSEQGIESLLRPGVSVCEYRHSRYGRLYRSLYACDSTFHPGRMTTGDVIQSLKVLAEDVDNEPVLLLGSHGSPDDSTTDKSPHDAQAGLPSEVAERLAGEIKRAAANGNEAGFYNALESMLVEVLRTHLTLRRRLLRDFLTMNAISRFRETDRRQARQSSPIPVSPGKRDLVLLAAGVYPVYFHNRTTQLMTKRRGIAVYLDVSGSVNDQLPKITGILRNMQDDVETVFLFSNKVVEIPFSELVNRGKVKTTFGTDFDCVAESILERGFDKAVVITDGYATLSEDNLARLKRAAVRILTILTEQNTSFTEFPGLGPVVELEEVVEGCG